MLPVKNKIKKGKFIYAKGSRKSSVARVRLYKNGQGELLVNDKNYKDYFRTFAFQEIFLSPLLLTSHLKDVNISIKVQGGGIHSQVQACRHAISRALIELEPAWRPVLKAEGFLTRDPRIKERKKPGLKRARRAPQWSKR